MPLKTLWDLAPGQFRSFQRLVENVVAAYGTSDPEEKEQIWLQFLSLPKRSLLRGKNDFQGSGIEGSRRAARSSDGKDAVATTAAAASSLIRRGYLSKAASTLQRANIDPPPDALEQLAKLHPVGPQPQASRPQPEPTLLAIDMLSLKQTLCRSKKAKAPGVSGWTEELLWIASQSPVVRSALSDMLIDAANGDVSPTILRLLRASRLVAIPKSANAVRPLAVGEAIMRIASKLALNPVAPALLAHFGDLQYCLQECGVEKIVHSVRAALKGGSVVVTLDMKNAFNTLHRPVFVGAVKANDSFRVLLRHVESLYVGSSDLLVAEDAPLEAGPAPDERKKVFRRLSSASGVRQGDVLGPVLFSLGIHDILLEARQRFPGATIKAYLDDITVTGDAKEVIETVLFLDSKLPAIGLHLNPAKCGTIGPGSELVRDILGIAPSTSLRVLGAYIGDDAEIANELRDMCNKSTSLLSQQAYAALEPLSRLSLLRFCTHAKPNFLMRTHDPAITQQAASIFDLNIAREVLRLAGIADIDPHKVFKESFLLCHIPVRMGGLGLRCYEQIRTAAYTSSACPSMGDQEALTAPMDASNAAAVDESSAFKLLRMGQAKKGASAWLAPPSLSSGSWTNEDFAAALQLRLGMGSVALVDGHQRLVTCECGHSFTATEWHQHIIGCAAKKGRNVSTTSRVINDVVFETVRAHAAWSAPLRSPPVTAEDARDQKMADLVVGNTFVDWTVVNVLGRSRPTIPAAEKRKERHYQGALVPVLTCAWESTGAPSAQTRSFLRELEALAPSISARELMRTVQQEMMRNSARIVVDGRRRLRLAAFPISAAPDDAAPDDNPDVLDPAAAAESNQEMNGKEVHEGLEENEEKESEGKVQEEEKVKETNEAPVNVMENNAEEEIMSEQKAIRDVDPLKTPSLSQLSLGSSQES